jgi:hypothetical protein
MEEDISEQHRAWFTLGVRGIGLASLLSNLGHEVPTSLLPRFVASTLGGSAALGVIEGIAGRCRNRVRHSAPPQVGGEGATTDPPAVRPVMKGRLGKLMVGATAFELGNVAATLLILRTTVLLTRTDGSDRATEVALLLYTAYTLRRSSGPGPALHAPSVDVVTARRSGRGCSDRNPLVAHGSTRRGARGRPQRYRPPSTRSADKPPYA